MQKSDFIANAKTPEEPKLYLLAEEENQKMTFLILMTTKIYLLAKANHMKPVNIISVLDLNPHLAIKICK